MYKRYVEKRNGENVIPLRNAICGIDMPKWELRTANDNEMFLSGEAVDKLAELEDRIENRTLIDLPCKVGDTVYTIDLDNCGNRFVDKVTISEIVIFANGIYYNDNSGVWLFEIYKTKAEAEKKLEELRNER